MAWDGKIVNNNVYPKGQTLNIRALPLVTSKLVKTIKAGTLAGRTTGATTFQTDGTWFQLLLPADYKTYAYVRNDVVILKPAAQDVSETTAKSLVDAMVNNDILINNSLIRSAVILSNLKNKGVNIKQYQTTYDNIQKSWNNRQNKIKASKLLKYQTGLQKGYDKLVSASKSYFELMADTKAPMMFGIGAIPIIGAVILVVIGAGLATAAYFAFKPDYDQGAKDLKVTKELEAALSKVDPETAQKIKDQLGEQIDTAYNEGKIQQKMSSVLSVGKYFIIGALGFLAFMVFKPKSNGKK